MSKAMTYEKTLRNSYSVGRSIGLWCFNKEATLNGFVTGTLRKCNALDLHRRATGTCLLASIILRK